MKSGTNGGKEGAQTAGAQANTKVLKLKHTTSDVCQLAVKPSMDEQSQWSSGVFEAYGNRFDTSTSPSLLIRMTSICADMYA